MSKAVKKHWSVSAHGDTVYVKAANKAKAVEVVEGTFGVPPGAVSMDVKEIPSDQVGAHAPDGSVWLA